MKKLAIAALAGLIIVMAGACGVEDMSAESSSAQAKPEVQDEEMDDMVIDDNYVAQEGVDVIYLAGGCFWGLEQLMQNTPGVVNATSGYANGHEGDVPTYNSVVTGATGYRETVRVEYDTEKISLDTILFVYFNVIDTTVENAQGGDVGTQYQTGVYYADEASGETVNRIADIERGRHEKFVVEIEPLERFYDAEDYHQNYLEENPFGYCHIPSEEMDIVKEIIVDAGDYPRPMDEDIKEALTEAQYRITQDSATEPPFNNAYWDNHERGIYVDVVTGEPLFSSGDKFDSGTGWPSFTKSIDPNVIVYVTDESLGVVRTEVRSRAGDSHLGHAFYGENESPSGVRYCINSAALRFIPYDEMEAEGYSYLKAHVVQ